MNGPKILGVLVLCCGVTGCATNARRETNGSGITRTSLWSKPAAPKQVQVSLPPEQPDLFGASAVKSDKHRLARYFPGLGRPAPESKTESVAVAGQGGGDRSAEPVVATASPSRPSWFGFRKSKVPHTYLTDARNPAASLASVEPAILPVTLQLPRDRMADSAVTPTNAELPAPADSDSTDTPTPSNPDASSASADPLSTTEPHLAVKPFEAAAPEATPQPATAPAESAPEATATGAGPAASSAETPAVDPRERPRLPSSGAGSFAATDQPDQATAPTMDRPAPDAPSETVAPRVAASDPKAVKAMPTAADPTNSLGLPPATVPASYSQHNSVAVRGSYQTPQPPPVLASPQVAPSAQSAPVAATGATKTWRRPCLRRLIRRVCNLGEYANPPTAKPH